MKGALENPPFSFTYLLMLKIIYIQNAVDRSPCQGFASRNPAFFAFAKIRLDE
jgi:hypothetical protein